MSLRYPDWTKEVMMLHKFGTVLAIVLCLVCCGQQVSLAQARILEIYPGTNVFGPAAQSLLAGDTLIVHQGIYNETYRMSIQVRGRPDAPITITRAEGESRPLITRPSGASLQNTINIEGSATWLALRGLEVAGNGGDGIKMTGALSYITLEDLVVHDIDVGISFQDNMHSITVRHNHIYNTGIGGGTGEGMYVGCNNAACIVQNSLIEQNWIHDSLPGTTQGDGIEVKVGSHSNIIRDNVIYNRAYPGIFVYGTGTNPANIVEGNVVWNSLEGIYAVADAIVRNNIVFNSGTGLSLYGHVQVSQMKNVIAVNNILYQNDDGIYMRWDSSASNMILANNAIYSPTKNGLNLSGSVGTFVANYVEGKSDRALDGVLFIAGGSSTTAFVDSANNDFWPRIGSPLIGSASGTYIPFADFNANSRTSPFDVGAYETDGLASNPGWRIMAGFKELASPPDTTPPTVALTTPSNDAAVSGTIAVSAGASDNVAVAGVQFKLDGAALGSEVTSAPYSVSWDTTVSSNGSHTLSAIARDTAGNTATSAAISVTVNNTAVDTIPPTVRIIAPPPGTVVSRNFTISADASDNVGVVGVRFLLDGTDLKSEDLSAPYSIMVTISKISNGPHNLTAVARDTAGNSTTSLPVSITVRKH
jgi:hypothetical protein